MKQEITQIINGLEPVFLEEIDRVSLMDRIDTKFIIHVKDLMWVLENIQDEYSVLEIDKNRFFTYSSLYFDTPSKKFYHDHHNRKVNRIKIRIRKYVESNTCFLEIKEKDGKGKTTKTRMPISDLATSLPTVYRDFIEEVTRKYFELEPVIQNDFNRITLVNKTAQERLTIDFNLSFRTNGSHKTYNNLVIIEIKQQRFNRSSPVVQQLKLKQINPYKISKYCIGMISIYHDLKYNRFKQKLIKINKLIA